MKKILHLVNMRKIQSLRAVFTVLFLVMYSVILIAYCYEIVLNFRNVSLIIDTQQELRAQNAVNAISNFMQDKKRVLENTAEISNLSDKNPEYQKAFLQTLLGKEKTFSRLLLLDSNNHELTNASIYSRFSSTGIVNKIKVDYISELKKNTFYISKVHIDETSFEPMIIIAVPVKNIFGDMKFALVAEVNLKFMWNLMSEIKIGKNGLAYLIDRKGSMVAFKDVSRILKGENIRNLKTVNEFVNNEPSGYHFKITRGLLGNIVVTNRVDLGFPDWSVIVELPILEAYSPVVKGIIGSVITFFLCIFLAIISQLYLTKKIIIPLRELRDATKYVEKGNFEVDVAIESENEVGELASSFNSMVKTIKASTTSIENLSREISERKIAEMKLRESEEKFRTLSISFPIGVMLIKEDSSILFTNSQWDLLFEQCNTNTKWEGWGKIVSPEFTSSVSKSWEKMLFENSCFSEEFSIINSKQERIWVEVKALRLLSDNGSNIIIIANNISNRKKAEKEAEQARIQLINSEKLAGIGQLAAGIAHEINNPVGFVLGNSETLVEYCDSIKKLIAYYESKIQKEDISRKREELDIEYILGDLDGLLNDNIKGLQRIIDIVTNLKSFARIGQCKEMVEADIEENLNYTISVAKNEIKYHATIVTNYSHVRPVYCNIGEINQVFLNILINAVQAIQEQHRSDKGLITISTSEDEYNVYCSIADDGPGIKNEIKSRIFEPFFTTKPVGKGTGLGLNIAWDIIVNRHKGNISVESTLGKGTCFTIRLPSIKKY